MIQANELRIGNWLYVSGNTIDTYQTSKPKQVTIEFLNAIKIENEERPDGVLTWFNPIPLTPEILEKCGFDRNCILKISQGLNIEWSYGKEVWLTKEGEVIYEFENTQHLHQLQNLYWCLCGKELEINLQ